MPKSILLPCLAVVVAVAMGATGQTREGHVTTAPGVAAAAQTVNVTGTIAAVDHASRAVTLVGPKSHEVTLVAGPGVQNFGAEQK